MLDAATTPLLGDDWHGMIYDGTWRAGGGGDAAIIEPATGNTIGRIGIGTVADVAAAAQAAADAQPAWAANPWRERAAIMLKVADLFATNMETLALSIARETGGTYEGLFYRPTVLTGVEPGMRAFEEEIFGPVASITIFDTDDAAVALANRTDYGLSAGIISASIGRAIDIGQRLRTGSLHINDQTVVDEGVNPFGGRGASGNGGSVGGPANWEEFSTWQWTTIQARAPMKPF